MWYFLIFIILFGLGIYYLSTTTRDKNYPGNPQNYNGPFYNQEFGEEDFFETPDDEEEEIIKEQKR